MLRATSHGAITRIHLARTVLGHPLRTVEAYLVDGLLIDSGPPATACQMVAWCRERDVRQVINTHHHEDHSGGDASLGACLGLPVAAPAKALLALKHVPHLPFYRRLVWGQPADVTVQPLGKVVSTAQHRFLVIPTPGHSTDHVCFFEPDERWLFSGDLFIHERARYLRADEDAHRILASLRRVLALQPRLLICSHAGFVEDGSTAIVRKIAYWENLLVQAHALREEGLSVDEVTRNLLGPEGLATRISRGHFSKQNLVNSLLSKAV